MKFAAVCTVLCLGLAVQARPQGAKPTVHGDPAPASHTADFKPTVHGDPQSAFGATPTVHGDPEPVRPTGDITPTFHSDPAPVETPGLANPFAKPQIIAKIEEETTVEPELESRQEDQNTEKPKPTESKPQAPTKPESSEENGSAEGAGRRSPFSASLFFIFVSSSQLTANKNCRLLDLK